ncbi:MAG: hypothetical protein WD688_08890 [Candidatus Binatia bacterium]
MAKDYRMKADPVSYVVTGNDVALKHTVMKKAVKKNWLWFSIYAFVTLFGIFASYFTSEWLSVVLSFVVAVITFFVGFVMLQTVITITNERR